MTSKKQVLEQFGANAEAYVSSVVHAKGASLARLVELLKPGPDWQVLDVATGAGHTAFALAPHVARVYATDITPQMLEQAQKLAAARELDNVVFETADAGELPYAGNRFDLVTCRIAPHHFADIPRFVAEATRVLRRDGRLALVDNVVPPGSVGDYINAFEKFRDPSHGRCLSLEAWIDIFKEAGLVIKWQETLAKRLDFSFWAQRHDPTMQAYLRAMLLEAGTAAVMMLDPQVTENGLNFRLVEGLIVGQKAV